MIKKIKRMTPVFLLLTIILMSVFASSIVPFDPQKIDMSSRLCSPSLTHLFGTDSLGRDVFSRVVYGGRKSLLLAFFATFIAMIIGIFVGFLAGYYGKKTDMVITIASNIFLGIPGISIMIAFVGIMGPSIKSLLIAIIINSWVKFSRIVRGEVMQVKNEYFVEAAKNIGGSDLWIFVHHILPNLSDSLIVLFSARIGQVILSVASLSYLGLGLQPPEPDWAIMISDARPYFRSYPVLVLAPGLFIVAFVWSVLSIGDGLREKMDVSGEG
jgi:peptide/nickel transport system permease protein